LGRSLSPARSPGSKRFFGHENFLKMHTLSINFISFTAEMTAYARQKRQTLPPLNPCMVVYKAISELVLHQVESVRG